MFCAYPALVLAFAPVGGAVHLAAWEKVVAGATSFSCDDLTLTRRQPLRMRQEEFTGSLAGLKPNLWRMRLTGPDGGVTYRSDGRTLYESDGRTKRVVEYRLPGSAARRPVWAAAARWVESHPTFALRRDELAEAIAAGLWEMTAQTAANLIDRLVWSATTNGFGPLQLFAAAARPGELAGRFDVTLTEADDYYVYFHLIPRRSSDRWLHSVGLALTRPDSAVGPYRPAHVRLVHAGSRETEDWVLGRVELDPPGLTAESFRQNDPLGP